MQNVTTTEQILLTRGVPAPEALPAQLMAECFAAALNGPDGKAILQYGHNGGYLPLRKLIGERYGVTSNEVLVSNGSLHLQDMLAALLIKSGDVVLVEQPTYDRSIKTFRRRGAKVIGVPLEHDGVDLNVLEELIKKQVPAFMYLIPDFQNPAGMSMSIGKRKAVVDLAEKHGFWLIEDIPYHALRYWGESLPHLRDISPKRVLTISSYSKLISPALRVGYVAGPTDLIAQLQALVEDTILSPVLPSQAAVVEFHNRGYFEKNLASLKQLYTPRLRTMIDAVKRYLPSIPFTEPEGGFFLSLYAPEGTGGAALQERAKEVGLVLSDGRGFFADSADGQDITSLKERFIRLPFCALTPEQIDEGVKRLAAILKS